MDIPSFRLHPASIEKHEEILKDGTKWDLKGHSVCGILTTGENHKAPTWIQMIYVGAFPYGALNEFGLRNDHCEEDSKIISHGTIERFIDNGEVYRIMRSNKKFKDILRMLVNAVSRDGNLFLNKQNSRDPKKSRLLRCMDDYLINHV